MEKQASVITIYKRGKSYYCDVSGAFSGGFHGALAGNTPEEAALFALTQKSRYIKNNKLGGLINAPQEVREAMAMVAMETTGDMIIRKVPESLRREFKSLCAKEGKSMQEKVIELMSASIAEKGDKKYFIKHPQKDIEEPAWKHGDGTLVSYWDNLPQLLIQDEEGARLISHADAKEFGYEK